MSQTKFYHPTNQVHESLENLYGLSFMPSHAKRLRISFFRLKAIHLLRPFAFHSSIAFPARDIEQMGLLNWTPCHWLVTFMAFLSPFQKRWKKKALSMLLSIYGTVAISYLELLCSFFSCLSPIFKHPFDVFVTSCVLFNESLISLVKKIASGLYKLNEKDVGFNRMKRATRAASCLQALFWNTISANTIQSRPTHRLRISLSPINIGFDSW